jgi:hypothetical protein
VLASVAAFVIAALSTTYFGEGRGDSGTTTLNGLTTRSP